MTQGRSIRLFLVDGTSRGLLTAEIVNWTGHVLTGPRSRLGELVQRPECARTGVYFLVGPDPETPIKPLVYIGETDNVAARLRNHNRPEADGGTGGRDFWERVIVVTSKDQNLTKAHVGFLENQLLAIAREVDRCNLVNGKEGRDTRLPEADRSDMNFFLEQIRTVLPVLGHDFLRPQTRPQSEPESPSGPTESPEFVFEVPRHGLSARGREIDGEFYVLEGSTARGDWKGAGGGYEPLFQQLVTDGVLAKTSEGRRRFTRDNAFSSRSRRRRRPKRQRPTLVASRQHRPDLWRLARRTSRSRPRLRQSGWSQYGRHMTNHLYTARADSVYSHLGGSALIYYGAARNDENISPDQEIAAGQSEFAVCNDGSRSA